MIRPIYTALLILLMIAIKSEARVLDTHVETWLNFESLRDKGSRDSRTELIGNSDLIFSRKSHVLRIPTLTSGLISKASTPAEITDESTLSLWVYTHSGVDVVLTNEIFSNRNLFKRNLKVGGMYIHIGHTGKTQGIFHNFITDQTLSVTSTDTPIFDGWHHIVFISNEKEQTLYINAKQVHQTRTNRVIAFKGTASRCVIFVSNPTQTPLKKPISVDDILILNTFLTPEEIQRLYTHGVYGITEGLPVHPSAQLPLVWAALKTRK